MFDIDNTLAYTGFNDTDLLGKAPPMKRAVDFAKRWCHFGGVRTESAPFECFFITARYCTTLKAKATQLWVKENFPVDDYWMRKHVFITGGIGGCKSQGCSVAYKSVLRNWLHAQRNIYWVMSVGDQLTDSAGSQSGVRVKVPNFWFDSSVVPNPQANGGKIHLQADRSFSANAEKECRLKCVIGPDNECINAGMDDDAINKYSELEYCLAQDAQKAPDQVRGCTINLLTLENTC
ncbi:Retrovirus-related Pol polyprotein from transposon TNT 1-94 [Durusdinium trenchii]|uniref:Retrovirus-related Pol polyprotein from transposon TNT 1-94 n=1 Tax=Durusdinium trenchii TaxID=1381693 RepID=A0ABP0Q521_9DINO